MKLPEPIDINVDEDKLQENVLYTPLATDVQLAKKINEIIEYLKSCGLYLDT